MIRRIFAVAKNTFREAMRDRILLSAVLLVLGLIAFSLFIGSISLGEEERMIVDVGLSAIFLLEIFVAVFIGSMLLYKEIERKTFFLLVPKPITREEIIIGKCFGLFAATAAVTAISGTAMLAILYFKGSGGFLLPILAALGLSLLESLVIIFVSVLFSGMFPPILSAVGTVAIFLIGHSGDILLNIVEHSESVFLRSFLQAGYYGFPNLEKFNIRNDAIYQTLPGIDIFLYALLYALCYTFVLLILSSLVFRKREF